VYRRNLGKPEWSATLRRYATRRTVSFDALNVHLLGCCRKRMGDRVRGHDETIGARFARDLATLSKPLPPPYDACEKLVTRASSLSLVRYRRNDCADELRSP
jgi:hypothetical protein